MHVVGGEVGHRAAAVVVVVDPHHPGLAGRQGGVAAAAGLDGGLLIRGDHVLVAAQRFPVPFAGVQVQYPLGFGREVGSVMKIHDWYCHGLSASSDNHRRTVDGEIDAQIPSVMTCRASSGHDHRDNGSPRLGRAARHRLDLGDLHRGEHRRATGPFRIAQRGQPRRGTPAAPPLARGVLADPQRCRDRALDARRGEQHDHGTQRQPLRGPPGPGQPGQFGRCGRSIRSGRGWSVTSGPPRGSSHLSLQPHQSHAGGWSTTRRSGTITPMAAPPASTKTSLQQRLSARARERWPELAGVDVKFRGAFAYVTGRLPDGETLPLMRLRYGGYAARWGFAIYLASKDG